MYYVFETDVFTTNLFFLSTLFFFANPGLADYLVTRHSSALASSQSPAISDLMLLGN